MKRMRTLSLLLLMFSLVILQPVAEAQESTTATLEVDSFLASQSSDATTTTLERGISEGIIQEDNQERIMDTTVFPYNALVSIESMIDGRMWQGTGVMIGPDTVLTAAHNVYSISSGTWTNMVTVTPAQNGEIAPYGHYQVEKVYMLSGYQENKEHDSESDDVAVLKLSEPVAAQVGILPVSDKQHIGDIIQVTGYPYKSRQKKGYLYTMHGEIEEQVGKLIGYSIDTEAGQSGSPILNQQNEIIGVHVLGFESEGVYYINAARAIQADVLEMIQIAQRYLEDSPRVTSHVFDQEEEREYPIYRLYHKGIKRHLYTIDENEAAILPTRGWRFEGEKFFSKASGKSVYRLYSPVAKEHLYTTSSTEKNSLITRGWRYEGVAWYSAGERPVYRLYHQGLRVHLYTADRNEWHILQTRGWKDEGIAWYSL